MTLVRAAGLIGGLTLVSRILGFARDMMLARLLGAGFAADAFNLAFKLPNVFRRLFAEGAMATAFVPLFSREKERNGLEAARRLAEDVFAVLVPTLLLMTAVAEAAMPALVWLINGGGGFADVPGKLDLAVSLSRLTFPYLLFISLAALCGAMLNSLSRFAASASAPVLLNLCLIGALIGWRENEIITAHALAAAVFLAGVLQLLWLLWACRRAGIAIRLRRPVFSPAVAQFGRQVLPAAFGAGLYQISQLVDLFFASRLAEGALSYLNYADRLNQLPLGVVGIALGTALLPALSAHVANRDDVAAREVQNRAVEAALFLCIPAAAALVVLAEPLTTAFYLGGRFDAEDAAWTAATLACLALGLPAYVLAKILMPGFFVRGDMRTPVITAGVALVLNVVLIMVLTPRMQVAGLALATAISAWLNCALLYAVLLRRGQFSFDAQVRRRALGVAAATALMVLALTELLRMVDLPFDGSGLGRIWAVLAVVASGGAVYLSAAALFGAIPLAQLRARLASRRD